MWGTARARAARGRIARWSASAVALTVVLAGCTWSSEEPGFFPSRPTAPERTQESRQPIESSNPALPVVGEAVWTSGDGQQLTSRYAVHAIRRVPGATLLDWSITPLSAPNLTHGDPVPSSADFGITTEAGAAGILLVDGAARRVYRPLALGRDQLNQCLCTPTWAAQLTMRVGETRLLQTAYPALPAGLGHLDVLFAPMTPVTHVPVTPIGLVPAAIGPTDLSRPALRRAPASAPAIVGVTVRTVLRPRAISIAIDTVHRGRDLTSVTWTVRTLRDLPRFGLWPAGPPLVETVDEDLLPGVPEAASGPGLRTATGTERALWVTRRARGSAPVECLCTPFGLWASSLRNAGGAATVTTTYPALPAGTTRVDIVLPGAGVIAGLPVEAADDAATRSGPATARSLGAWNYNPSDPPRGWAPREWPTPTPDLALLDTYTPVVDAIVPLPRS